MGPKLFKEDLIGIEGCLGPDGQIIEAHGSIVCLSGVIWHFLFVRLGKV
jgi:hypothetical protein